MRHRILTKFCVLLLFTESVFGKAAIGITNTIADDGSVLVNKTIGIDVDSNAANEVSVEISRDHGLGDLFSKLIDTPVRDETETMEMENVSREPAAGTDVQITKDLSSGADNVIGTHLLISKDIDKSLKISKSRDKGAAAGEVVISKDISVSSDVSTSVPEDNPTTTTDVAALADVDISIQVNPSDDDATEAESAADTDNLAGADVDVAIDLSPGSATTEAIDADDSPADDPTESDTAPDTTVEPDTAAADPDDEETTTASDTTDADALDEETTTHEDDPTTSAPADSATTEVDAGDDSVLVVYYYDDEEPAAAEFDVNVAKEIKPAVTGSGSTISKNVSKSDGSGTTISEDVSTSASGGSGTTIFKDVPASGSDVSGTTISKDVTASGSADATNPIVQLLKSIRKNQSSASVDKSVQVQVDAASTSAPDIVDVNVAVADATGDLTNSILIAKSSLAASKDGTITDDIKKSAKAPASASPKKVTIKFVKKPRPTATATAAVQKTVSIAKPLAPPKPPTKTVKKMVHIGPKSVTITKKNVVVKSKSVPVMTKTKTITKTKPKAKITIKKTVHPMTKVTKTTSSSEDDGIIGGHRKHFDTREAYFLLQ